MRGRYHLKFIDIDGKMILKCIWEKGDRSIVWIGLNQHRNRWRAYLKAVIDLRFL
jgi:hypothetical protein